MFCNVNAVLSNLFDHAGRKNIDIEAAGRTTIRKGND